NQCYGLTRLPLRNLMAYKHATQEQSNEHHVHNGGHQHAPRSIIVVLTPDLIWCTRRPQGRAFWPGGIAPVTQSSSWHPQPLFAVVGRIVMTRHDCSSMRTPPQVSNRCIWRQAG